MNRSDAAVLLGVSLPATPTEVKKARRRHARLWHPDRQTDPDVAAFAGERMARINEAAALLLEDEELASAGNPGSARNTAHSAKSEAVDSVYSTIIVAVRRAVLAFTICVTVIAPLVPRLGAVYGIAFVVLAVVLLAELIRGAREVSKRQRSDG